MLTEAPQLEPPADTDDAPGPVPAFSVAREAYPIAEHLIAELDCFVTLLDYEPAVDFIFRHQAKRKHQRRVLGTCCMPSVNGELSALFDHLLCRMLGRMPDFLITLDLEYWTEADERQREILVCHELLHCGQSLDEFGTPRFSRTTGQPLWAIQGHDIEEFHEIVRRYGGHNTDIQAFVLAATEHYEKE